MTNIADVYMNRRYSRSSSFLTVIFELFKAERRNIDSQCKNDMSASLSPSPTLVGRDESPDTSALGPAESVLLVARVQGRLQLSFSDASQCPPKELLQRWQCDIDDTVVVGGLDVSNFDLVNLVRVIASVPDTTSIQVVDEKVGNESRSTLASHSRKHSTEARSNTAAKRPRSDSWDLPTDSDSAKVGDFSPAFTPPRSDEQQAECSDDDEDQNIPIETIRNFQRELAQAPDVNSAVAIPTLRIIKAAHIAQRKEWAMQGIDVPMTDVLTSIHVDDVVADAGVGSASTASADTETSKRQLFYFDNGTLMVTEALTKEQEGEDKQLSLLMRYGEEILTKEM